MWRASPGSCTQAPATVLQGSSRHDRQDTMSWHRISLNDVPLTPWRNGKGNTRELVAFPVRDQWHWRMSVADIETDGPFSRFEGVKRWFAVLSGAGVRLSTGGAEHL